MDKGTVRVLEFIAAQLVLISVGVHLFLGIPRVLVYSRPSAVSYYLNSAAFPDPRPFLFTVSAIVVLVGLYALFNGLLDRKLLYLLGIAMMCTYIGSWVLWHTVINHGQAFLAAGGHTHGGGILTTVIQHLVEVPLDAASKLSEVGAALIFGLLYWKTD
ncbi:hypothetical protein [Haladaptatus sp. CMSO5]|uniref:hypothetical protein n=1 Tax=Haladaptatus sp. CMSO5 TaxID=3120514 RepID=UPI002FCE5A9D